MITLRSALDIDKMRAAGRIASDARALAASLIKPGISTLAINRHLHDFISASGAVPSFLNYNGFPKSICISINDEVIHGIPCNRKIKDGDIVSVDVGALFMGFHGDCAASFIAGSPSDSASNLVSITRQSFFHALNFARKGFRISDISHAIQSFAEAHGFSVVRDFVGHGVGSRLHEEPEVPNFGPPGRGVRLIPGMTIAVEPMINLGLPDIRILDDGWTVVTADGLPSAHYENTILITNGDPEILTPVSDLI